MREDAAGIQTSIDHVLKIVQEEIKAGIPRYVDSIHVCNTRENCSISDWGRHLGKPIVCIYVYVYIYTHTHAYVHAKNVHKRLPQAVR